MPLSPLSPNAPYDVGQAAGGVEGMVLEHAIFNLLNENKSFYDVLCSMSISTQAFVFVLFWQEASIERLLVYLASS